MALVDVDSWIIECEACERLSDNIKSQIAQRDREAKLSKSYSKISADVRTQLRQFFAELAQLKSKLTSSGLFGDINPDEIERRQRQVEILQSKLQFLQNKFRSFTDNSSPNCNALFQPAVSELWESNSKDKAEPLVTTNYNVEDLQNQQIQILEDQNEGLEALSRTILRQKELALRLGEEVDDQNDILDDLVDNMDGVETRINLETRYVGVVTVKDRTCGYWIVIILIFIAIIIVATI